MPTLSLGTFMQGELPHDLTYAFLDNDGTPINLDGYSIESIVTDPEGSTTQKTGSIVNTAEGTGSLTWEPDMTAKTGKWSVSIWAIGERKLSSPLIRYNIAPETSPS